MKLPDLEKIRPEFIFLFLSAFFGLAFLFITPPFQSPDEINHFYKASQISEGHFISVKKDSRVGGEIPVGFIKLTEPFIWLRWNDKSKTNKEAFLAARNVSFTKNEREFVDFPNTAMYSFISYVPQAVSIFIGRSISLSPLYIFYLARIITFLFWIVCVYYTIKNIPIYKWLFVLLALLPMSLFINMSLSADVVTNAIAFLLIAFILKAAFVSNFITTKHFIIILALTLLLASAKMVYVPVSLLFFIIPKQKFRTAKTFYSMALILFGLAALTVLGWSKVSNNLYTPYADYNPAFKDNGALVSGADMHLQTGYILSHGFYFFDVMLHSLNQTFSMYYEGYIGTFGWLDTKLPKWLIAVSYLFILIAALFPGSDKIKLTIKNKLIIFCSFFGSLFLLLLSQHLTWDVIGGDTIYTIQGRYFIPLFPLLFMLLYNTKLNYSKAVALLIIVFSILALSVSTYTLYTRYYVD